jgi:hypothetical protein
LDTTAAILPRFFDANPGDCPFAGPWYADRQPLRPSPKVKDIFRFLFEAGT